MTARPEREDEVQAEKELARWRRLLSLFCFDDVEGSCRLADTQLRPEWPELIPGQAERTRPMELWNVLLYNDDVNSMDHVVRAIQESVGYDEHRATMVMLEAHNTGIGVVITEPLERAEFHRDRLSSFGLTVYLEPAD